MLSNVGEASVSLLAPCLDKADMFGYRLGRGVQEQWRWRLCDGNVSQEQQSFDVVDEVRQSNLHRCSGDPYGADE
jgi:hypothetical protein